MLAFDPEHPSPHANALVVDMINTKVVVASAFITVLLSWIKDSGSLRKNKEGGNSNDAFNYTRPSMM